MSRLRFGAFLAPHHPLGEHPSLLLQRDLELAERLGAERERRALAGRDAVETSTARFELSRLRASRGRFAEVFDGLTAAWHGKNVRLPAILCGMAGSFGFEAEHYELSQQIGELVLFPALRRLDAQALVCAPGTSCRHQILDALGRTALHPAEVLFAALRPAAPHP